METTPVHTLNLASVQTESKSIIKSSYTHFIALSLFFLPLSVALVTGPSFLRVSPYNFTVDHLQKFDQKRIIYQLLYVLIGYVFALCATASITCSTHHGFLGKPVTFLTALKSLTCSFFPILWTALVALLISLSFLLFAGSILMLVQHRFAVAVDYNPVFFILFIVVILYFHVNWSLAFVVVVVESKRGIEALMRSSYLIKGMGSVSLMLLLTYGTLCGLLVSVLPDTLHEFNSWEYVLFTMIGSSYLMWFLLQITTANTVLYDYCKELHGELATGSAEGFAHEYISLLASDEKVPCVATVTTT